MAGPPAHSKELEAALQALRARFPGAIIERYLAQVPRLAEDAFVAAGAAIVGDVGVGEGASVWYGCVLRGDINRIQLGARSNLQDGCVVHVGDRDPALIGADVVVGHRALIHGCQIEDGVLVGMGAILLDGAVIGHGSVIAAGSLVTAGTRVPPRSLVLGVPGKVTQALTDADEAFHRGLAAKYTRLAHNYRHG